MSKSRYSRYQADAISLLKHARIVALARGATECDCTDVLQAVLDTKPAVLSMVLSANNLELAQDATPIPVQLKAPGDATPLPLSSPLRAALDSAEASAGTFRVSAYQLFEAIWPSILTKFATATHRDGASPDAGSLEFPGAKIKPEPGSPKPLAKVLKAFGREMGGPGANALVGREKELASVLGVLVKYFKPNPMLLGEPGVGKTAIVEHLARLIQEGNVPKALVGKRIVEISATSLSAGAVYHGQLEDRVRDLLHALEQDPDIILFVDEVHTLMHSGRRGNSISQMLKPALARGTFRFIGATTNAEYHAMVAADEAFARRFQLVQVDEPCGSALRLILERTIGAISQHHAVRIPDTLLDRTISLCAEALPSRRFPDKAFDVLDRASATASIAGETELCEKHVEQAVADLSGMPHAPSSPEFLSRIHRLEHFLADRVLGQPHAIKAVANTVRLCKSRLDPSPSRPDGVFLFLGPTGVGKTSLACALAEAICGRTDALVRLDMSEFSAPGSTSRILGADPGYVGHDSEPALVRGLQTWHTGVLLLDEFEKAHPEVQRLFLTAFDEGTIRDSKGRSHSLSNFTIVATSNALPKGAAPLGFRPPSSSPSAPSTHADTGPADLLEHFPPELLNRFDELVVFRPLAREQVLEILRSHLLADLNRRLAREHRMEACVEPTVLERIAEESDFARFGARELQRVFRRTVVQPLLELLEQGLQTGGRDGVTFRRLPQAEPHPAPLHD